MDTFVLTTWLHSRLGGSTGDGATHDGRHGERGANLVEYILLVVLIATAVMGTVAFMGGELVGGFDHAASEMSDLP